MIPLLFWIGAAYDGLLGVAFLGFQGEVFHLFGVTPPNHPGYVHFSAALLLIFAVLFANIARDPRRNRNLIPYGILLKISYCATVFGHWAAGGIPDMWKPFAFADLIFLGLFVWAYASLGGNSGGASSPSAGDVEAARRAFVPPTPRGKNPAARKRRARSSR
jgi:hypothetical protein